LSIVLLEAMPAVSLEEATTTGDLERLRPEWSALWARCPAATPFQSPEWLIPWWRHLGEGALWTLALRSEGRLAGLVPLYVYTEPGSSERQLFLVGIGTTDYVDGLFDRGFERPGMEGVFAHLEAERHRWDVADFQPVRSGSPLLEAPAPAGWSDDVMGLDVCPVLTLPPTVEGLAGCVPSRLLHNLRYYWRRAEKLGRVSVERATAETLDELREALLRLHAARWSTRGLPGVLADGAVERMHQEALPSLLSLGVLRLYALRLDDRIIACYYGFVENGSADRRAYYYLSGFDPEYAPLSPGTLIIGHAVREAIREGAKEFDFLRGQESYKYLWGANDTYTHRRWLRHEPD
jgi:CelD/BcsL family acetyltransferase involved in cellulose biosynthesis